MRSGDRLRYATAIRAMRERHAGAGDGQRSRTAGRVSMDMLAVDLTDLPGAGVGSRVVLWARAAGRRVAEAAGTISYELFCALARACRWP